MKKLLEFIKKLFVSSKSSESPKGFTLIELLIVIAVVGVLAAAVLIALNPIEQFKRARDAGLKEAISTIGRQLQGNYTLTQDYQTYTVGAWLNDLVGQQELVQAPAGNSEAVSCSDVVGATESVQNNICYKENGTNFIIMAHPESSVESSKFTACVASPANTWIIYQSTTGKTGTICMASSAEPGITTSYTYK